MDDIRNEHDIHAVVLQANGERAFCTGMDIKGGGTWIFSPNVWKVIDPGETLAPRFRHKVPTARPGCG